MMFVWFILCSFLALGVAFVFLTSRIKDGPPVTLIFGKRGVGKSSDIIKRCLKHKRGRNFCSDLELVQSASPDARLEYIAPEHLGKVRLPVHSLLFIEECGILFHKRGFTDKKQGELMKNFRKYLKMVRHEGIDGVIMYSQCYDIDLSLKEACSELWLYTRYGCITYGKKICKSIVLTTDADGNGTMSDSFTFYPFFMRGCRSITLLNRYMNKYDSFTKLTDLEDYDLVYSQE